MNLYLLNLIGKWIGVLFVTITSFFAGFKEKEIIANNTNKNMSLNLTTEVIQYQKQVKYNDQKPKGQETILVKGEEGYLIKNHDNHTEKVMKEPVTEIIEIGTYVEPKPVPTQVSSAATAESFVGKMTMYYNCPNRSICKTSSGYNLKKSVYYNDSTFGTVRILSAARTKFPHGTIIEVAGTSLGTFYGIVLDNGGDMNTSWTKYGKVHIDLAIDAATEKAFTTNNVTFNVKRWGY